MRKKEVKKLELPAAAGDKTYFYQLEVCFLYKHHLIMYLIQKGDTFLWKLECIVKNSPSGGYILPSS